jgi:phenylpyruvate tautomerase PptA (4-oxalocrotonate tautomerase family)
MIDVYAPAGLLPDGAGPALLDAAAHSLLRWEGAPAVPPFTDNTAAYLHELPAPAVRTAAGPDARTVRIQVLTPPGALDREAQRGLVAELTGLVAEAVGDPGQAARTWVLLTEAAEGGWGVAGTALGREEFTALRAAVAS